MFAYVTTVHRNGQIREFKYRDNHIYDVMTGEIYEADFSAYEMLRQDLRRQGFKPLPYNPLRIEMTAEQKEVFIATYGFEF